MKNYTPLKVKKEGNASKVNSVLIAVAVVTALVLAGIFFLMIRQKTSTPVQQEETEQGETVNDKVIPPPPQNLDEEEATPSPELQEGLDSTPEGDLTATPSITPSVSPTP